jgi:hypothetical protein
MIDPVLSLAVSMRNNKGVYALLLGSGISRSSGIPTGWEIVQDLVRQLAHLKNEHCEPNPDAWFRQTFGSEPEYSDLLHQIAKSPAERTQLLRGFFEPTEQEQAEGRKRPTPAHHAIAALVARGYVRVIVTTNFDRLLEVALTDIGIQPTVISTADAATGALPLTHSPCSIIKINGDYLDTRIRNTSDELERYDEPLEKLLGQVFDEYGLIVAGWSSDWDTALRRALERCPTRRFTTYWTHRVTVNTRAADLIALRGATAIPIADADTFFREVNEKVIALEVFSASDPLSAQVAVARVKKYLSADAYKISLADLFLTETERVHKAVTDARFPLNVSPNSFTGAALLARMQAYEAELSVLLPMLVCGAYWALPEQQPPLLKSFKRLADQSMPQSGAVNLIWLKLREYPALVLMYAVGLGALANSNYRFLKALFDHNIRADLYKPEKPAAATLHNIAILNWDEQKFLPGRAQEHTPLSNHLFEVLREPLRQYLPDDYVYETTFDWFEYLVCLTHIDQQGTRKEFEEEKSKKPDFFMWAPVGRFGWKNGERSIVRQTEPREDGSMPAIVIAALQAGFCEAGDGTRTDKYLNVRAALGSFIQMVRHEWGVFF